ncbi:biorientation of chromosomes in cell division protein 1-like protein [Corchorus olitorius]|uniref:Biorientation of chromosomes in cell division protein 1-like protein n=1 Tax=Corchorus olitorius TaxID=93759 RepID=A0A1R3KZQ4_9ROSI|nr:biorientation of chromosomes in cell division protein 1-like protein [Corchorus olitorius]
MAFHRLFHRVGVNIGHVGQLVLGNQPHAGDVQQGKDLGGGLAGNRVEIVHVVGPGAARVHHGGHAGGNAHAVRLVVVNRGVRVAVYVGVNPACADEHVTVKLHRFAGGSVYVARRGDLPVLNGDIAQNHRAEDSATGNGLLPDVEQQRTQQRTHANRNGGGHGAEDNQRSEEAAGSVARPHHHVCAVGGVALVDGELTRQDDDVANRQANHQAGDQRGNEVGHREHDPRAQQQRRNPEAHAGLDRPADVENTDQRAFDNTGEQEARAERRHRAVNAGVNARFQHRHEGHFVKRADAVEVVHVRPGKHAGGEQANEDRERPVGIPKTFILFHSEAPVIYR